MTNISTKIDENLYPSSPTSYAFPNRTGRSYPKDARFFVYLKQKTYFFHY